MLSARSAAVFVLALLASAASADSVQTFISWPSWSVSSSEDLYNGRRHSRYPISFLLDGKPETAWVFSGKDLTNKASITFDRRDAYRPGTETASPIAIDEVRLMNGYNKSQEIYFRNDRVSEVEVWAATQDDFPIKRIAKAQLPDAMGWHSIHIPPRDYTTIQLVFSKRVQGKEKDLCISEVQFRHHGVQVNWGLPSYFLSSVGDECGDGLRADIVDIRNRKVATADLEGGFQLSYNPNRSKLAFEVGRNLWEGEGPFSEQLKVLDMKSGHIRTILSSKAGITWKWIGNDRIRVNHRTYAVQ